MKEIFKSLNHIEQEILQINKTLDDANHHIIEIKELINLLKKYTDK